MDTTGSQQPALTIEQEAQALLDKEAHDKQIRAMKNVLSQLEILQAQLQAQQVSLSDFKAKIESGDKDAITRFWY